MTEFSRHPNQREYAIRLLSAFSEDLEPETSSKNILYIEGATLPARSKLDYRPRFLEEAIKIVRKRDEYSEGLFRGL
jgi:hypothetical protein